MYEEENGQNHVTQSHLQNTHRDHNIPVSKNNTRSNPVPAWLVVRTRGLPKEKKAISAAGAGLHAGPCSERHDAMAPCKSGLANSLKSRPSRKVEKRNPTVQLVAPTAKIT